VLNSSIIALKVIISSHCDFLFFKAPGEAEAECTALCKSGKVFWLEEEVIAFLTEILHQKVLFLLFSASI
jgi:hypothetical protein